MGYTQTDRGFTYGDPHACDYGNTLRLRESSSAEGAKLWLDVEGSPELPDQAGQRIVVHLNEVDQEWLLAELTYMRENHYQRS